jgi:hypothetical protein
MAVLISLLLPALNRAREQAKLIDCESNFRQIAIATLGYTADNKGMVPPQGYAGYSPIQNTSEWFRGNRQRSGASRRRGGEWAVRYPDTTVARIGR